MEEALLSLLMGNAAVSALVGDRIHWQGRPQATPLPAVVLTGISRVDDYSLSGATGPIDRRVQVDCWASTFTASKAVERAVIDALGGFTGTQDGVHFYGVFLDGSRDLREDTDAERISRVSLDFLITYTEAN